MSKIVFYFSNIAHARRAVCAAIVAVAVTTLSHPTAAQTRPAKGTTASGTTATTDDQRKAQEHFQRAKELYQAGSYRDAITELDVARGLDPDAKDLVMNLGIVHEKLGEYDEAITFFKHYLGMEAVTPAERTRAEGIIKRIEGAKRSAPTTVIGEPSRAATSTEVTVRNEPSPPRPTPVYAEPAYGRIDALTVTAGTVAIVGLVVGSGLGIYALLAKPTSSFVTGRDGTYANLEQKTADAHSVAVVADVSFGVGVVAALGTAWLYFARTKSNVALSGRPSTRVSAAPTRDGGVVLLGGSF